jgi:hypothetical protein
MSGHCNGCRCGEIVREVEALRKLLEATARPRLSVQHKDAPAVLGIGKTSFERYVAPSVPCWREGSMRVYAIKDLERFLDQHKALVLKSERCAA